MGSWDYKLFDNDDACDLKDDYREQIILGMSDEDAESYIIHEFELGNDENYMLWLPFAVTQWKIGRLSQYVKDMALRSVDKEFSEISDIWETEYISKRKNELIKYKNMICEPMCARKKLRMPWYAFRSPWKIGSVLQYRLSLSNDNSQYDNKYVMLLVSGEEKTPPDKIPMDTIVFRLYGWCGSQEPCSIIDEINKKQPELIKIHSSDNFYDESLTVMLSKSDIKDSDIKCISDTPLMGSELIRSEIGYPVVHESADSIISESLAYNNININE